MKITGLETTSEEKRGEILVAMVRWSAISTTLTWLGFFGFLSTFVVVCGS